MTSSITADTYHRPSTEYVVAGLARVFTRVDSALAGQAVHVTPTNNSVVPSPAYSSGNLIYLNLQHITDEDISTIINLQGLNYHELAHVLYTPRALTVWAAGEGIPAAFNVLEDQRIESLLAARFPGVEKHLSATVYRWILSSGQSGQSFPLIRGRQYLPLAIRQAARREYADQTKVAEIAAIIDEYRLLDLSRTDQLGRAKVLIRSFAALLHYSLESPCASSGSAMYPPEGETVEDSKDDNLSNDGNDGKPQQAPGEPEDGKPEDGEPEDGEPEDDKEGGESTGGSDGTEAGTGKGDERPLRDAVEDALEEILNDPDIVKEAQSKRTQARVGNRNYREELTPIQPQASVPTSHLRVTLRRFTDVLRDLISDTDPDWDRNQPSGKLNLGHVINGYEEDEVFDRWDSGNEGYDLDVVTLIDTSSSMFGYGWMEGTNATEKATEAAWIIDNAVKEIGGTSRVYSFADGTNLVYGEREKTSKMLKRFPFYGGTRPVDALRRAEDTLTTSRRANQVAIIVTDGEWEEARVCDEAISRMRDRGVMVAVAYVNTSNKTLSPEESYLHYGHGAEVFKALHNSADLPAWGQEVVKQALKRKKGVN